MRVLLVSSVLGQRLWSQERNLFPNGPFKAMVDRVVAELEAEGPVAHAGD